MSVSVRLNKWCVWVLLMTIMYLNLFHQPQNDEVLFTNAEFPSGLFANLPSEETAAALRVVNSFIFKSDLFGI